MTDFLLAESAIRQLHARYIDAVWRQDVDAFVDCFAADAVWKIAGMQIRGRAAVGSRFEKLTANTERTMMFLSTPILEIGQGTATGRTHVTECIKLKDGKAMRTLGIYYDRFVDQGERWRFEWRHFDLHYYGPPDFSAPFYECKEYGPPPGMPGPDDPTTVRKNNI